MKREDLKELGLDSEKIDSIMKLHGQSINDIKDKYSNYDELKAQNDDLTKQVAKNDKDLKTLRSQAKDNEELSDKIKSLEADNKTFKENSEKQINQMKLDNAVDGVLSNNNVRNSKAVKGLLDMDSVKFDDDGKLTGLDDQIAGLKKSDSYLFDMGKKQNYTPDDGKHEPSGAEILKDAWG
ncbi:phage capsid protein [Apilactobacillus micheneri]|uniref:phage scaffolding protein n=1 Tax=Apilactobacillus micheneri TaxID=1899430 RepID=UPI00112C8A9B|nr:phage scaffolding protein [Apilactobacillus micheneri]TPR41295.1 phage capsid protein [Apilactobacillus micheneri]